MDTTLQALFEAYQEHPIAYMPIYSRVTGSVTAGILLSQIVYWDGKMQHRQFYKTDKDFCEELAMGVSELKSAKKRLVKMGLIGIDRKGIPARTHYKLNLGRLSDLITTSVKKNTTVSRKPSNKKDQNKPTNTDITQEIIPDSNIYAFSERKGNNVKDTIENHLENHPSDDEEINDVIDFYLDCYLNKLGKHHPKITLEQFQRMLSKIEQEYANYEMSSDDFRSIISSWFEDENVKSNYNIIHFATEGVIKTHFYRSVY